MMTEQRPFVLPLAVVSPIDLSRLLREVKALGEYLLQANLRKPGETPSSLPRLSLLLEQTAKDNGLNLLVAEHRDSLTAQLELLRDRAPVVHISFATDPSSAFTQKLVNWFRSQVHPHVLILVGLQPGLAAGCTMRTTNKYFDMSLRKYLISRRDELAKLMGATQITKPTDDMPVQPVAEGVPAQ